MEELVRGLRMVWMCDGWWWFGFGFVVTVSVENVHTTTGTAVQETPTPHSSEMVKSDSKGLTEQVSAVYDTPLPALPDLAALHRHWCSQAQGTRRNYATRSVYDDDLSSKQKRQKKDRFPSSEVSADH